MNRAHLFGKAAALASCVSMCLPPQRVFAAEGAGPQATAPQPKTMVADVALQTGGTLRAVVVDGQGTRAANVNVTLHRDGKAVADAVSDERGRVSMNGLAGGVYLAVAGKGSQVVRLWAADTAPPNAPTKALLVSDNSVVRGQRPLGDFFTSDVFIVAGVIAAAVAIPVAIHNSRHTSDSGS